MSRTNPQVNIRLDDKAGAQKRADADYRGNLTAYINDLIALDIAKARKADIDRNRKHRK